MNDDKKILQLFGHRLRTARLAVGLSQEALAHESGLHRTYIGSVERGERNIALLNIVTLATVLKMDAGSLLAGMSLRSE
ncbi:helix-turn-helix domain-containing protein [Corynebacterium alimapuense]|uniref:Transcriptional regulator n=1 Tax=Corynebacterium alimapuense TaxID=1576874 RepID=A0A3M8K4N6_9CORY|nr:helix-turn-helix transcriptional regulator [Corynebacterium alimapuense]RNE48060.1 transcriptional regulator [Corynebacterium alimapuense]